MPPKKNNNNKKRSAKDIAKEVEVVIKTEGKGEEAVEIVTSTSTSKKARKTTEKVIIWSDYDATKFWRPKHWIEVPPKSIYVYEPTRKLVDPARGRNLESIPEKELKELQIYLGYSLPKSYLELLSTQNGGNPKKTNYVPFKPQEPERYGSECLELTTIYGTDKRVTDNLRISKSLWIKKWHYPDIGIYFGTTMAGGHVMFCLDYCQCGPRGEPVVVSVDQECDYHKIFVAKNFETFIRGLGKSKFFN